MSDAAAVPGAGDLRNVARYLWWLVKGQGRRVWLAATLGTGWMVGLAVQPYLLARAIDDGLRSGHFSTLLHWVLGVAAVGLLIAGLAVLRHQTMTKVRMDGAFRTVRAVTGQSTRLGAALDRQVSAGEVVTIGIGDVWVISTSLTVVGPGVGAVIAYLVVAALLLSISPLLAAVVLLGAPLLAVVVGPVLGRLARVGAVYREEQGALTARMVDIVEGLHVLNGIGGKETYAERYREGSRRLRLEGYRVGSVASWVPALGLGVPAIFLAAVTWLGARMAAAGTITIGDLVAVYGYVAFLVVPVEELIWSGSILSDCVVSTRRVIAFLRLERAMDATGDGGGAGDGPLSPADLHDPPSGVSVVWGRFTAVAGAHPAESAAVVDRLGGFSASDATWGGVRLSDVAPSRLRRRVLVADNDAEIFSGSLREVVSGRSRPPDETIASAVWVAAAEDIVDALPGGLSSMIDAHGRNLSGGQRQRVRLVRALLAEPDVLLAVEPTSAVDAHTEALIASRLHAARAGRTTVVTTTSSVLLGQADTVCYLVDGRVAASGSHRHLLANEPGYRRLVFAEDDDLDDVDVVRVTG
jgi:ABC-type multidrug transport system fused ATPase/permease subunit